MLLLFMSLDLSHVIHIIPTISLQQCNDYGEKKEACYEYLKSVAISYSDLKLQ